MMSGSGNLYAGGFGNTGSDGIKLGALHLTEVGLGSGAVNRIEHHLARTYAPVCLDECVNLLGGSVVDMVPVVVASQEHCLDDTPVAHRGKLRDKRLTGE